MQKLQTIFKMTSSNLKTSMRFLLFALISLIIFTSGPAYSAEIKLVKQIEDRGYLRVGIPPYSTPPFYYLDEQNKLKGYDVDIVQKFAKDLNLKIIFDRSSKSFNDLVKRAGANEIDIAIGKLGTTYERMKDAHPHEYMNFRHSLLMNRKTLASIQGDIPNDSLAKILLNSKFKLGFIANSAYDTYANVYFPNVTKKGYASWDEATKALLSNDIDAIYRDSTEIKMIVYQTPSLSLKFVPILFEDLLDQKSIYVSTQTNSEMGSLLDYFLSKEIGIKTDTQVIEVYPDFYNPTKK